MPPGSALQKHWLGEAGK